MARVVLLADHRPKRKAATVFFSRGDLNALLGLYSQRVARGDWRDYAIGQDAGLATFSVFRHSHETPVFTVTKRVQVGMPLYAIYEGHRKLRQSPRLADTLVALSKPLKLISM